MAISRNAIAEIAVGICFLYPVLQVAALGQLTGQRRGTGFRYVVVAVFALLFVLDWLLGAPGWAAIEVGAAVLIVPVAVVHLAILLIQELREA